MDGRFRVNITSNFGKMSTKTFGSTEVETDSPSHMNSATCLCTTTLH